MSMFLDDPSTLVPGRLATFKNWPYTGSMDICIPKTLAEAGFIYRPDLSSDATQCFVCHKIFSEWDPKDNPIEKHREMSPECAYVTLVKDYGTYEKAPRKAVIETECARFHAKFMYRFLTDLEAPKRASYESHLKKLEEALAIFVKENGITLPLAVVRRTRAAAARKHTLR
nr:baculoviral IAP repeat containing protein [Hymenolepis microstoma]